MATIVKVKGRRGARVEHRVKHEVDAFAKKVNDALVKGDRFVACKGEDNKVFTIEAKKVASISED